MTNMSIERVINGEKMVIELTEQEVNSMIKEVRRQDDIDWAIGILEIYAENIVDFDDIIDNEDKLVEFAKVLDNKNLNDNGDREIETIIEMFNTVDLG